LLDIEMFWSVGVRAVRCDVTGGLSGRRRPPDCSCAPMPPHLSPTLPC